MPKEVITDRYRLLRPHGDTSSITRFWRASPATLDASHYCVLQHVTAARQADHLVALNVPVGRGYVVIARICYGGTDRPARGPDPKIGELAPIFAALAGARGSDCGCLPD
jgi:hypothetical protein